MVGQNTFDANIAISRDGQHVAYIAGDPGIQDYRLARLYLRALDTLEPTLLSESARGPFFSPDGQWIGFVDGGWHLSKIARTGGPVLPIADIAGSLRGASWASDDTIIYGAGGAATGLFRVSAAIGGEPERLTMPDTAAGEGEHLFPQLLPGERAVLFTILNDQQADNSQIALLDLGRSFTSSSVSASSPSCAGRILAADFTLRTRPLILETTPSETLPIAPPPTR